MNQQSPRNNLSAIVLAGGKSQRTSPKNKLIFPFQGKTIIQSVLDEIMPLVFTEVLVVIGHEESRIRETLLDYPVRFIFNPNYKLGMSTSIRAGVSEARSTVDGYMIFLGDMPWIEHDILKKQIQSFYRNPKSAIVAPAFQKRRGNPVIFAHKYKNDLLKLAGDTGARVIIEKYEDQVIEIAVHKEQQLKDVDNWRDYNDLN